MFGSGQKHKIVLAWPYNIMHEVSKQAIVIYIVIICNTHIQYGLADQKMQFLILQQEDPLGKLPPSKDHSLFTRLKGREFQFHK